MLIGAHVSTAGGLRRAVGRTADIGAEAMQIFASSPRGWAFKTPSDEDVAVFRDSSRKAGLGPTVLHAIYLVSLGSPDPVLAGRSAESLTRHLETANRLGALGLIFHAASHRGAGLDAVFDQFVSAMGGVLDSAPGEALLMLENSAGQGNHIGSTFAEIGRLVKAIDSPRVRVCLDTQHSWAAGYDIASPDGLHATMGEFDREIGLELLSAVHMNDSKRPLGSGVDRHENIGEGLIGREGLKTFMSHPVVRDLPFYLEVPGFGGQGPDARNVAILKTMRDEVGAST